MSAILDGLWQKLDGRPLIVETEGLVKRYRRKDALTGLDLSVPEGSVYLLAGPNGAGKSTTLRILMDLVRADGGSARVFDRPVTTDGPGVRAEIGYVPEGHDATVRWLSVARLLAYHGSYYEGWDDTYAGRLAESLDVPLEAKVSTLSKGEVRRVQLILALAHRPRLLVLDEPMDGLDPLARDRVAGLLVDHMAETPTTLFISTHHVRELDGLADHVGVLRGGRLVAQLERTSLVANLCRYRVEVPEGWDGAAAIGDRALDRRGSSRDLDWVVWGPPDEIAAEFERSGAVVRDARAADLEDAVRVLLALEDRR